MKITVYHKTDRANIFQPYEPGHAITQVFEFEYDGLMIEPETLAEFCFAAFNDNPAAGWLLHAEAYYEAGNRSLSIGDVVVFGEVALAVDRFGWNHVSLPMIEEV